MPVRRKLVEGRTPPDDRCCSLPGPGQGPHDETRRVRLGLPSGRLQNLLGSSGQPAAFWTTIGGRREGSVTTAGAHQQVQRIADPVIVEPIDRAEQPQTLPL